MKKLIIYSLITFGSSFAMADTVKIQSHNDLEKTTNNYIAALKKQEIPVLAAKEVQQKLSDGTFRQVKEIVYPSPYYGWNLGECRKGTRHDFPLKTYIWQDEQKRVWLEYTEPEARKNRFGVMQCGNEIFKTRHDLHEFAYAATVNINFDLTRKYPKALPQGIMY